MKLNGIIVSGKEVLHENYSFKGVWQAIEPSSAPYQVSFVSFKKSPADYRIQVLLGFLEGKNPCQEDVRLLAKSGFSDEERWLNWFAALTPDGEAGRSWYLRNREKIHALWDEENSRFSDRSMGLLCLFLLLHIQAGRDIEEVPEDREREGYWEIPELNRQTAAEFMRERLRREALLERGSESGWGELSVSRDLGLPYWRGLGRAEAPMELVGLVNSCEQPVRVSLEGTGLLRELFPGETLYVIRKDGLYVDFLPRFTVSEEKCLTVSEGKLIVREADGARQEASVKFGQAPAVWAYDEAAGLFSVGWDGGLSVRSLESPVLPGLRAVDVRLFGSTYSVLLEDGSLLTNRAELKNWRQLLQISPGLNQTAGICSDRRILFAEEIPPVDLEERAASISVWESHAIWLDTAGGVHSEQKNGAVWNSFHGAAAVGICSGGYVIALGRNLYRIPFGAPEGCREEEEPFFRAKNGITEIAVSDLLLAYRELGEAQVHLLPLEIMGK